MEKRLTCRAMGLNCNFTARGEAEGEIVDMMKDHLKTVHAIEWSEALRAKAGDLIRLEEAS